MNEEKRTMRDVTDEMARVLKKAAGLANRVHDYALLHECSAAFRAYDVLVARERARQVERRTHASSAK